MKSICIKTNNTDLIDYISNSFIDGSIDDVCYSCNKFKLYENIIIHYLGKDDELFFSTIATTLSCLVIDFFEDSIINRQILNNYFYFDTTERTEIYNSCLELLSDNDNFTLCDRQNILFNDFYDYISSNKNIVLNGFINFRIKDYINIIDDVIDTAVNNFIIEREYWEFISILRLYINSQLPTMDCLHLIYTKTQCILTDNDKNIIDTNNDIFNSKFLSDISFSENDFALNSLLNILPQRIYIHLVNRNADEFINTIQLIFENRVIICNNCDICNIYKIKNFK